MVVPSDNVVYAEGAVLFRVMTVQGESIDEDTHPHRRRR